MTLPEETAKKLRKSVQSLDLGYNWKRRLLQKYMLYEINQQLETLTAQNRNRCNL